MLSGEKYRFRDSYCILNNVGVFGEKLTSRVKRADFATITPVHTLIATTRIR